MIAGTLEIQLLANVARLAKDMGEAKSIVEKNMSGIEAAISKVKGALAILGVTLSVGFFASMVNGSIEVMDHLSDLHKSTNVSIEDLSGLSLAAKQSGGDLDSIAASINKLSVSIGKDPEKFKALGISAKDPIDQLKQLADIYVALDDPGQRAAVAAAALGKSWAGTAPLLAEGSKRIGEMIDNGTRLSGVTKESAEQAKIYHDQMAELGVILGSTRTKLIGDALPSMNEIALAMQEAAKQGGLLLTVWVGLGGAMAHLLGLGDAQKTASRLTEIADQLDTARKQLQSGTTNPPGANSHFFSFLVPDIKFGEEARAKLQATIDALEKERDRLSPKAKTKEIKDGADETAIASIIAAEKAKQFLKDDYAARVAVLKIGGEAYAEAVRVNNQLADLAMKEGGVNNQRTREALLQEQQTNTADLIFDQMQRQQQIKAMAQQGEQSPKKVEDAAKASAEIEKLNAKLIASETITQAQIRAERTITAQQQADQYNAAIGAREQQGADLANSLRTATDRENEQYQIRLTNLSAYLASAQGQIADAADVQQQLEVQHQQTLLEIERNKHEAERSMQIGTWQLAAELMQTMAGKSKAAAIVAIAINKGLAIAQVIQSTAAGSARAFMDLPYYLAVPAAASIEAMGAIQIGLIAATGLMQAAGVSGGGASMGSPANPVNTQSNGLGASTPSTSSSAPPQQIVLNLTVNGHILNEQQFTDTVMVPALRDAMENRDVTIFGPNSRQAQNIVAETTG